MKTSNKILLALLSFLVLLPLLMLMGFRYKIAHDDYTVEHYDWMLNSRKQYALQPAKFIKVQAPDSVQLRCQLSANAKDYYTLGGYSVNDSLASYRIGDTLLFKFIKGKPDDDNRAETELNFSLYMAAYQHVLADGAQLTLDSLGVQDSIQISLINNSSLFLGNSDETRPIQHFGKLVVDAHNSSIQLYPQLDLQSFVVHLKGKSSLEIDKAAKIGDISGTVEGTAAVDGPASYLYHLLFNEH
jgi:hypothetical protein